MAELTDVLGAMLRDITRSRVISDLFSRDVGVEYSQDPILSVFPVPRLEIKQASIDLYFAVNEVGRKKAADPGNVVREKAPHHAAALAANVFSDTILENPQKDKLLSLLQEMHIDLQGQLAEVVEKLLLSSSEEVSQALNNQPEPLRKKLDEAVLSVLLADQQVRTILVRTPGMSKLTEQVHKRTEEMVQAFVADVLAALNPSNGDVLRIDVAVTRQELTDVRDALLSRINLVTEVRNYEWTQVGEQDGKPVRRLRPE